MPLDKLFARRQQPSSAARVAKERRSRRSSHASEALTLQLRAAASRYRLPSLVLADAGGNLWAASCLRPCSLALLAALRRRLPEQGRPPGAASEQGEDAIAVRQLAVGPATLYLAARGQPERADQALAQTASSVERILGALL